MRSFALETLIGWSCVNLHIAPATKRDTASCTVVPTGCYGDVRAYHHKAYATLYVGENYCAIVPQFQPALHVAIVVEASLRMICIVTSIRQTCLLNCCQVPCEACHPRGKPRSARSSSWIVATVRGSLLASLWALAAAMAGCVARRSTCGRSAIPSPPGRHQALS
ncbi:hypothetical protein VFPFJ_11590 [Purpureocillium lilacinum]|uniref:Uncharacterized protein n=1 Tax=Purpureocillium lilacinum TaxID=33203 RepID=A0A179F1I4_PURLI|nr:hypothetical protein VFPFJ_11590 [Purpureocillium lilacinum]OAQ59292.1 hypothetical protein VFPFJ_11590 [Purpureocillium lilacinum]